MKHSSVYTRRTRIVVWNFGIGLLTTLQLSAAHPQRALGGYVPGEVVVVLSTEPLKGDSKSVTDSIADAERTLPGKAFRSFNVGQKRVTKRIRLDAGQSVEEVVKRKALHPRVLAVHPNYLVHGDAITPNDPDFIRQWGLRYVHAPEAWDTSTGSRNIIVAVIDSGIRLDHPDLQPNIWHNTREIPGNGIDDDGNGYRDDVNGWNFADTNNNVTDLNSHGTHVAGIIGALGNNAQHVAGIAWNVQLMVCRLFDASLEGDSFAAAEAITYAVNNGARIINASWGWGGPDEATAVREAIQYAANRNVLFVCTAGNDGRNIDDEPYYPPSYNLPNMICVAALSSDGNFANFSNYGEWTVDIAAPGELILSTSTTTSGVEYKNGTSMAAPFVSGTAALMCSITRPDIYVPFLKTILFRAADQSAALGGRVWDGKSLNTRDAVLGALPSGWSSPGIIWVDFNATTDPDGSFVRPHLSVQEGVSAVQNGGRIFIKAGVSAETITISKPVTIEAFKGTATIGQ